MEDSFTYFILHKVKNPLFEKFNKEPTEEQKEIMKKCNEVINKWVKEIPPYKPHSTTFPYIDL